MANLSTAHTVQSNYKETVTPFEVPTQRRGNKNDALRSSIHFGEMGLTTLEHMEYRSKPF